MFVESILSALRGESGSKKISVEDLQNCIDMKSNGEKIFLFRDFENGQDFVLYKVRGLGWILFDRDDVILEMRTDSDSVEGASLLHDYVETDTENYSFLPVKGELNFAFKK